MNMHDGLARASSNIDPDVVPAWSVAFIKPILDAMEQGHDVCDFIVGQLEEGFYVSAGHDEGVAG